MLGKIFILSFILSFYAFQIQAKSLSSTLWPDLNINDPKLSMDTVARQCQKSLMYAPEQLEAWCEKAYKMGAWDSLLYIGYHTGDGSRYVKELRSRVLKNELLAIEKLAWLYDGGLFVENNPKESARLYELFLKQGKNVHPRRLMSVHYDLAEIYKRLENWPKVIENAQYVIDHNEGDGSDSLAKSLKAEAQIEMNKASN